MKYRRHSIVTIKLYNDIVFKWFFGRQEHTGPLISLINAVIEGI
ncbi:hypothetical protein MTBBW1_1460003 [Desulfamplus magnetovallimortis]|uniref:Uncharacterized protein n=1 Tax=Desulfamplus magnetovallimortis TaxID=1246637 RepID=A0A1W1H883_9BACT|nr:hypothetical protein MTBBW1_1460003 [Desulfamplus magnetovallimortis]